MTEDEKQIKEGIDDAIKLAEAIPSLNKVLKHIPPLKWEPSYPDEGVNSKTTSSTGSASEYIALYAVSKKL